MVRYIIKILRIRNNYQTHKMVILNKDNINNEEITKKEIIFQIYQFYKNKDIQVKINKLTIRISLRVLYMVNKNQIKNIFYKMNKQIKLVLKIPLKIRKEMINMVKSRKNNYNKADLISVQPKINKNRIKQELIKILINFYKKAKRKFRVSI